jgi:hypothetical protein
MSNPNNHIKITSCKTMNKVKVQGPMDKSNLFFGTLLFDLWIMLIMYIPRILKWVSDGGNFELTFDG